jgi:hypothetical protein
MPLIGTILKHSLEHRDNTVETLKTHEREQNRVLRRLLRTAVNTQFGVYYDFESMLYSRTKTLEKFKSAIPLNDYDTIHDEWWYKCQEGQADICWPGKIKFFALSSGTSGASSKYIPVTMSMIRQIRKTSIREIINMPKYNLPVTLFTKGALMLGGSTELDKGGSYYQGDLSGITTGHLPYWFQKYYLPGSEISKQKDWSKKIEEIVKKAKDWDVAAIVGVPSWFQILLEKIIEEYHLKNIHELWPNLTIFIHGGVSFKPYKAGFEKLLAHPLIYMETYLASEGFIALQTRPDTDSMQLVTNNGLFFEFLPFNEKNFDENGNVYRDAKTLSLNEVKTDEVYALVLSSVSGAWRYLIGDTIKFTDLNRCEIQITGRTKHFLSICGEHLSQENMNMAIERMENELNVNVKEFTVAGIKHDKMFAHHWYIGTDDPLDPQMAKESIDKHLKILNDDYRVERIAAINELIITILPSKVFYDYMEYSGKIGAQFKFPRVIKGEKLTDWEKYIENTCK